MQNTRFYIQIPEIFFTKMPYKTEILAIRGAEPKNRREYQCRRQAVGKIVKHRLTRARMVFGAKGTKSKKDKKLFCFKKEPLPQKLRRTGRARPVVRWQGGVPQESLVDSKVRQRSQRAAGVGLPACGPLLRDVSPFSRRRQSRPPCPARGAPAGKLNHKTGRAALSAARPVL